MVGCGSERFEHVVADGEWSTECEAVGDRRAGRERFATLGGRGRFGFTSRIGPMWAASVMNTPPDSAPGKCRPVAAPKLVACGKKVLATAADVAKRSWP